MKVYESKDIRNVGVVGHGHSGKTSLTAALLYSTGGTNRLTRADEGNTITDFDEEEVSRKITISTALAFVIYFRLVLTLGSVGTTAQAYLRVPIGVAVSVVFLGEHLAPTAWIGLACVVAGVAAMTIPVRRKAPINGT